VGWALLAGVTLDGVPENLALGFSLVEEASVTLLIAIFLSNFPESLVGAARMKSEGESPRKVFALWCITAVLLAAAVVAGRELTGGLSNEALSIALGFAGGAVLASLADTLMPHAYEETGVWTPFATAAGFFLAYVLAA